MRGISKAQRRVAGPVVTRATGVAIMALATTLLLLAGLALASAPGAFDRGLLLAVRRCDPEGRLLGIATDVTALGSGPVLTLLVAIVAGWLLVRGRVRSAVLLVAGSASAGEVADLVKLAIMRPRPELVPHWIAVGNYSYPSAHSTDSAAVATLLALIAGAAMRTAGARRYVACVAVALVLSIGASRVYLAVHWPSDVIAGWSFGTLWALGWWRALGPSGARE